MYKAILEVEGNGKLSGGPYGAHSEFEIGYWSSKTCAEATTWASSILFGPNIDSVGRAYSLIDLLNNVWMPDSFKWAIFQDTWPSCDNVDYDMLAELEECFTEGTPGWSHLKGDDLEFYNSLPETVRVYRGASLGRQRGWSWTTDRTVALQFAKGHRGIFPDDAAVFSGLIWKTDIWTVFTDRRECEVFCPPSEVQEVRIVERIGHGCAA